MTSGASPWIPVALSSDLPAGGVLRAAVGGNDLAVWRSRSGAVRAWDNRCPHRGMRLSHGFVRGESLTCLYHGWQYGTDGICHYIPAHPDLTPPSTLCVRAFACLEKRGVIWISLSDRADEPGVGLPDADPIRSLTVDQEIDMMRSMLATARFPITASWSPDEGRFTTISDTQSVVIREGRLGDEARLLALAWQALDGQRTALHVVTSPAASACLKIVLSRWLERVRWFAEHPDCDIGAWRPIERVAET